MPAECCADTAFTHNAAMTSRLPALPCLFCLLSAGTSMPSAAADTDTAGTTYIVVRHAEKATDDPNDPSLSDAGHARARDLASRLAHADLRAAYATQYKRTVQTIQPTTDAHGVAIARYDADQSADVFAARLIDAHSAGTVLVAGHSNTVPDIVSALCACETEEMPETEYDRISTVHIAADGTRSLQITRGMPPDSSR